MEHACPRCNSSVDDNSPFCPTCEAAQVRAAPKEYSRSPVIVAVEAAPPFLNVGQLPKSKAQADAHAELRSALYAGMVGALLSMIHPLASLMALPLAGVLSVVLYRRRSLANDPTRRVGFRVGALAGLFCFGLLTVLTAAETLASHTEADLHAAVVQVLQHAEARNADPQARPAFEYFMTPQGMAVFMILSFVFGCVLFVLLSGIGGTISASLLRRKGPPQP